MRRTVGGKQLNTNRSFPCFPHRSLGKDSDEEFFMTELTEANFDKIAMDEGKDVVIMIYKDIGCGGCMSLAVFYKRVALR